MKLRKGIEKILDLLGRVRLASVYYCILIITILIFVISMGITNSIAKKSVQREYQEFNESLFKQAQSELERNVDEFIQISYNLMAKRSINDFFNASSLSEKSALLDEVINPEFANLQAIKSGIASMSLYDAEGNVITNSGNVFYKMPKEAQSDSILFTGLIQVQQKSYFGLSIPFYNIEKNQIKGKCGYCFIMVRMSYLEEMLGGRLPTEDSCFVLTGEDGKTMVLQSAVGAEATEKNPEQANTDQSVYRTLIRRTSWTLSLTVPNQSLYYNLNYMQRINYITYVVIGVILLLFSLLMYASVLRPIQEQTAFMNYYAKNRKSRMLVKSHNEMGTLAESLNAMLDDIDRLTEENLRGKEKILEVSYQKKQSELMAYRNQINPHFLYNTFECIRGMALLHGVDDIAEISEALSRFFSYNVRGKGYAQIREVQEHIMDYAAIIGYRFMNKYRVELTVEESVKNQWMPKMILQPLVENAVFHGLEPKEEEGVVKVWIGKAENKKLLIQVEDNGCGMSENDLEMLREKLREFDRTSLLPMQKHGIGLLNIYRRLRLFYGETLQFQIESKEQEGTRITILVPLDKKMEEAEHVSGIFN